MKSILSCILTLVFLSNCEKIFKDPIIENIAEVKLINKSDSLLSLRVAPVILNPNVIGFSIRKMSADIFVNDQFVGNGHSDKVFHIKAKCRTKLDVRVDFDEQELTPLFPLLIEMDSVQVTLKGTYTLNKPMKGKVIKRNTLLYLNPQELISQQLQKLFDNGRLRIKKIIPEFNLNFGNAKAKLQIEINNNYSFDLELKTLECVVQSLDKEVKIATCKSIESRLFPAKTQQELDLLLSYRPLNSSLGAFRILFKGDKQVLITGEATINTLGKEFTLPFEQKVNYRTIKSDKF